MTAESAVASDSLMGQEVDPHHPSPSTVDPTARASTKPRSGSRRAKQYKCGNCHELGHNQKTCPRRVTTATADAPHIQPGIGVDASEIFASNVAPPLPAPMTNGHHHLTNARVPTCKLDGSLDAANKRVMVADKQVANAETEQEFEDATLALDSAVRLLERVAACAQRCAVVAHTLNGGGWDSPEREPKRIRMDAPSTPTNLTPTAITLNDATAAAASVAVDAGDVDADGKVEALD